MHDEGGSDRSIEFCGSLESDPPHHTRDTQCETNNVRSTPDRPTHLTSTWMHPSLRICTIAGSIGPRRTRHEWEVNTLQVAGQEGGMNRVRVRCIQRQGWHACECLSVGVYVSDCVCVCVCVCVCG